MNLAFVFTFLNSKLQLYVTGNLTDDNKVLIDIGTGYYVEKVSVIYVLYQSIYLLQILAILCW